MALSATELTLIRQQTGGVSQAVDPDHLTDDQINALYAAAGDDYDSTILPVIRTRWGMAAVYVNGSPEHGIEQYEARWKHLERLLAYYETKFGESGTLIQTGTLDTGIDYESSST